MTTATLSPELALRIGLAARALPEIEPAELTRMVIDALGTPLTSDKLATLTAKRLKTMGRGELAELSTEQLQQGVAWLRGERQLPEHQPGLPQPVALAEGGMPRSIRVACASNSGDLVDGHFGSCARFLIYQLSADEMQLIDIRSASGPEGRDDRNAFRAGLIADCQILYVASIGGPAAARVVRADCHPLKVAEVVPAPELLERLQGVIATAPPPWLARAMGDEPLQRSRLVSGGQEALGLA